MGRDHVVTDDAGDVAIPRSAADWSTWVSVTKTRNFLLADPVLDWLDIHGSEKGFVPDHDLERYDERTDFLKFVARKGGEFEQHVLSYLTRQFSTRAVRKIAQATNARSRDKAEETFDALCEGVPIVVHGVLWDPQHACYGIPDLLVRSDYVNQLVETPALPGKEVTVGAPGLGAAGHHYRVVEIKFTTLYLDAKGERVLNNDSKKAYKAQVTLYTRALGRWQEYEPSAGYLLGRRYRFTSKKVTHRGNGAFDRLGGVELRGKDSEILELGDRAIAWIQRVRQEGASWDALPAPNVAELRPNASNQRTQPWEQAHERILAELKDPSLLWHVGEKGRSAAIAAGFLTWDAPGLTPAVLGKAKGKTARVQQAILDAHHDTSGEVVFPNPITNNTRDWQHEPELEFFVDFETVTDIDDDFSQFPKCGGQPLILMIGCGYSGPAPERKWTFRCFSVDHLDEGEEARIIDEWLSLMCKVSAERLGPEAALPSLIHWSHAEQSFLQKAYNSALARHPEKGWPDKLPWFDFLSDVVRVEPIVVKGSLAFGLKGFAKALHSHRLIETLWGDGPGDGLRAMVGAWWCHHEARRLGCKMADLELTKEIEHYNEVDCRVMWEILRYLRSR